ncbi:MAG: ABC transporter ATP-binding protein, partial [Candidatus Riflebacteria bacterium]|nr:ABC transporter ATP-binding protein [Candidatus Riflebacteria bacterium]
MSFSIGSSGSAMGPRNAMQSFGKEADGRVFDPHILRRLLSFLLPHWPRMLAALVLMLISSVLALTTPYLIKIAIDQNIANGDSEKLFFTALLMAVVYIALYATTAVQQYLLSWVGLRVLTTLRARLFHHLQALPVAYHNTHIIGVTISRVISDVAVINDLLSAGVATILGDTVVLVGIVIVMLSMNVPLALSTFAVLPLMLLATWLFSRSARSAFRQTRQRIAAVVGGLAEDISGIRVIQAFAREGVSTERFEEVNRANRDAHIEAMSLSFIFLPTVDFLGILATAIVLWFGGLAVARGELS